MALTTVVASFLLSMPKIAEKIHCSGGFEWLHQKIFEKSSNGAGW